MSKYKFGVCHEHLNQPINFYSSNLKDLNTFKCQKCSDTKNAVNLSEIRNIEIPIVQNWPIKDESLLYQLDDLISKKQLSIEEVKAHYKFRRDVFESKIQDEEKKAIDSLKISLDLQIEAANKYNTICHRDTLTVLINDQSKSPVEKQRKVKEIISIVQFKEHENIRVIRSLLDKLRPALEESKHVSLLSQIRIPDEGFNEISREMDVVFKENLVIIMELVKNKFNLCSTEFENQLIETLNRCKRELGITKLPQVSKHMPNLNNLKASDIQEVLDFAIKKQEKIVELSKINKLAPQPKDKIVMAFLGDIEMLQYNEQITHLQLDLRLLEVD